MNKPQLFVFAGINGAGKSTFTKEMQIDNNLNIINPDVITRELIGRSLDLPKGMAVQAGRIALEQRNQFIHEKRTFGFESTLSSQQDFKTIKSAISAGFDINLIYVGLNSLEMAIKRVAIRVEKGGHDIPQETIERRYHKSLSNLSKVLPMIDNARIYDNSDVDYKLLLEIQNRQIVYRNPIMNNWAEFILNAYSN